MTIRFQAPALALALLATLAHAPRSAAQETTRAAGPGATPWTFPVDTENAPRPTLRAVRADGAISVDGRLDEGTWSQAEPVGHFVQGVPDHGQPATQPTLVRVLYDDDNLYVGAVLFDSDMDGLMIAGLEHDFQPGAGDLFAVSLDTFLDRRNSFLFFVNPGGAIRDEQTFNDSRSVSAAWSGPIEARVQLTDSAWVLEIAIPFTTVRFDPNRPVQEWGINFLRRVRRLGESSYWSPLTRRDVIHRMSMAGTLVGMEGIRPGRNLTIKPYALVADSRGSQVADAVAGSRWDGGVDAKYGITSGLTLDATWRTDFAQAELDQEQVNLTRFSLFFPERREFFLENSGVYQFGDQSERSYRLGASLSDFTLFHSRRIGLTSAGRPIPIVGGGRLSGKVGETDVGLLLMRTEELDGAPGESFAVARVKRNVLGSSDVGLMLTNRAGGGEHGRAWGADANLRVLGNLIVSGYLAGTEGSRPETDGTAARLGVALRNRFWNTSALVRRIDADFDPGVGYVRQRGILHRYATVGVHVQSAALGWMEEVAPYVELDHIEDLDGRLETRVATAGAGLTLRSAATFYATHNDRVEVLSDSFRIATGVVLAPARYRFRDASLSFQSSPSRPFSLGVDVGHGEFWSGTRTFGSAGVSWRPRHNLFLDASAERNDVELPEGSFAADVARAGVRYAYSTRINGSAFLQYNRQTDQWVRNVRLSFRHAPMSDVFLIYTERRTPDAARALERSVAVKATRLLAF